MEGISHDKTPPGDAQSNGIADQERSDGTSVKWHVGDADEVARKPVAHASCACMRVVTKGAGATCYSGCLLSENLSVRYQM